MARDFCAMMVGGFVPHRVSSTRTLRDYPMSGEIAPPRIVAYDAVFTITASSVLTSLKATVMRNGHPEKVVLLTNEASSDMTEAHEILQHKMGTYDTEIARLTR